MGRVRLYTILFILVINNFNKLWCQDNTGLNQIKNIEKVYLEAKILSFDGNIKYYTDRNSTSPIETMLVSYRRDNEKVFITIGDQIIIYDGKINVIIDEGKSIIYVSSKKLDKGGKILPSSLASDYLKNSGMFNIKVEGYLGNKNKIIMTEQDKSVASIIEIITQKETNFIEFARMIIDKEDEELDSDINKKKFEFSYYHYKTSLDEKIDISKYINPSKNGKTTTYKGVGKFKDFEIVVI